MQRLVRMAALAAIALLLAPPPARPADSRNLPFTPKGQRGAYNEPGGPTKEGIGETSPYASAKAHFDALRRAAHGPGVLKAAQLPDWSGVWNVDGAFANFDPSLARDASRYGPLTPDNQAFYDKVLKDAEEGVEWDALSYCLPAGMPRWTNIPRLHDFAVTPSVVYMINELQSEVRRIYTDGRGHRAEDEAYPLWEGDSIGFWDGAGPKARLVVWTNNIKAGVYHRNGPRYSDKTEVVEIWWKADPTHLKVDVIVYDPVDLTRPWTVHRGYVQDTVPQGRIDLWACAENNNVFNQNGVTQFVLPGEPGYKDPGVFADPTKRDGASAGK